MTAGRSFRTSSPTAGSKLTHHTSARFIGDISQSGLGPLQGFCLARLLSCPLLISDFQVFADHVRANKRLNELANPPPSDDGVQSLVDASVEGDGQLLLHGGLHTIRVTTRIIARSVLMSKGRAAGYL